MVLVIYLGCNGKQANKAIMSNLKFILCEVIFIYSDEVSFSFGLWHIKDMLLCDTWQITRWLNTISIQTLLMKGKAFAGGSSRSWTLLNFNNLPFYKSALRLSTFVRFMHFVEKTRWQFCSFGSMWWKSDLQYQEIRISHCWSQIIDVLSIIDHIHVYEERSMTTLTTMMMMTSAAFNVFSMWVRLSRLQLLPFVTWEQGDGNHGS